MAGKGKAPFDALIRKLERLAELKDEDRQALTSLRFTTETIGEGGLLIRAGEEKYHCGVLLEGYACRSKSVGSGGRQIFSFHFPGDILDVEHILLPQADHDIEAATDVSVAWVPSADLRRLTQDRPAVADALWRDCLIDASVFREWVLNVGKRDPRSRIAHMLCEFATRRAAAGLGPPEGVELPMSHERIADATGLSSVQVNRMLHLLAIQGIIAVDEQRLKIMKWNTLGEIAEFDPAYLHALAA